MSTHANPGPPNGKELVERWRMAVEDFVGRPGADHFVINAQASSDLRQRVLPHFGAIFDSEQRLPRSELGNAFNTAKDMGIGELADEAVEQVDALGGLLLGRPTWAEENRGQPAKHQLFGPRTREQARHVKSLIRTTPDRHALDGLKDLDPGSQGALLVTALGHTGCYIAAAANVWAARGLVDLRLLAQYNDPVRALVTSLTGRLAEDYSDMTPNERLSEPMGALTFRVLDIIKDFVADDEAHQGVRLPESLISIAEGVAELKNTNSYRKGVAMRYPQIDHGMQRIARPIAVISSAEDNAAKERDETPPEAEGLATSPVFDLWRGAVSALTGGEPDYFIHHAARAHTEHKEANYRLVQLIWGQLAPRDSAERAAAIETLRRRLDISLKFVREGVELRRLLVGEPANPQTIPFADLPEDAAPAKGGELEAGVTEEQVRINLVGLDVDAKRELLGAALDAARWQLIPIIISVAVLTLEELTAHQGNRILGGQESVLSALHKEIMGYASAIKDQEVSVEERIKGLVNILVGSLKQVVQEHDDQGRLRLFTQLPGLWDICSDANQLYERTSKYLHESMTADLTGGSKPEEAEAAQEAAAQAPASPPRIYDSLHDMLRDYDADIIPDEFWMALLLEKREGTEGRPGLEALRAAWGLLEGKNLSSAGARPEIKAAIADFDARTQNKSGLDTQTKVLLFNFLRTLNNMAQTINYRTPDAETLSAEDARIVACRQHLEEALDQEPVYEELVELVRSIPASQRPAEINRIIQQFDAATSLSHIVELARKHMDTIVAILKPRQKKHRQIPTWNEQKLQRMRGILAEPPQLQEINDVTHQGGSRPPIFEDIELRHRLILDSAELHRRLEIVAALQRLVDQAELPSIEEVRAKASPRAATKVPESQTDGSDDSDLAGEAAVAALKQLLSQGRSEEADTRHVIARLDKYPLDLDRITLISSTFEAYHNEADKGKLYLGYGKLNISKGQVPFFFVGVQEDGWEYLIGEHPGDDRATYVVKLRPDAIKDKHVLSGKATDNRDRENVIYVIHEAGTTITQHARSVANAAKRLGMSAKLADRIPANLTRYIPETPAVLDDAVVTAG